eukprot:2154920-Pyramimonas_sp.AAC.1
MAGPPAGGGAVPMTTLPGGGQVPVKPPPVVDCSHPDHHIRYYGNQWGSGSKCTACGARITWIPKN